MQKETDLDFMKIALQEAREASWPFGAVIVKDGKIIAQAGSGDGQDEDHDPTAHAEVNAIRRAAKELNTGDLSGTTLYASCEPCALCIGPFISECLTTGFADENGDVVLTEPERKVPNGSKLF